MLTQTRQSLTSRLELIATVQMTETSQETLREVDREAQAEANEKGSDSDENNRLEPVGFFEVVRMMGDRLTMLG